MASVLADIGVEVTVARILYYRLDSPPVDALTLDTNGPAARWMTRKENRKILASTTILPSAVEHVVEVAVLGV